MTAVFYAAFWLGCCAAWTGIVASYSYWRKHGPGRTARDRDDSGTGTGEAAATGQASASAQGTGTGLDPSRALALGISSGVDLARIDAVIKRLTETIRQTGIAFDEAAKQAMAAVERALKMGNLPQREDDTPILGYKTAALYWAVGERCGLVLRSVFTLAQYDDSDVASCRRWPNGVPSRPWQVCVPHVAPVIGCNCGFYAVRDRDRAFTSNWLSNQVLLDVELFGRVIVYEHGYRAERQRILRLGVVGCWYCDGRPSHLVGEATHPWDGVTETAMFPICLDHLPLAVGQRSDVLQFTMDEVAERFGCDVSHELAIPSHRRARDFGS